MFINFNGTIDLGGDKMSIEKSNKFIKMKKVFLVSISVLMIFLLFGCTSAEKSVKSTEEQTIKYHPETDASTDKTEQPVANVVQDVEEKSLLVEENGVVGKAYIVNYDSAKYEITLKEITSAQSEYFDDEKYLMANFEIKNIGDKNEYISPNIYFISPDSERYDDTIAIGLDDKYSKSLDWFKQLSPNSKMSGWVTIEIPLNIDLEGDLYFEYTNSYDSDRGYIKYGVNK